MAATRGKIVAAGGATHNARSRFIGGSTGEFYAMTLDERIEQLRFAARRIGGALRGSRQSAIASIVRAARKAVTGILGT